MKSPQPNQDGAQWDLKRPAQPQDPEEAPLSPEEKLVAAQADEVHWRKVAANPNLSPRAAEWARDQARSAAAEVRLRLKGAAYRREQEQKAADEESSGDPYLDRLLDLSKSPQGQPKPSGQKNQNS